MARTNAAAATVDQDQPAPARKRAARPPAQEAPRRPTDEVAAEWVPLSSISAWSKNPRKNADAVPRVRDSLIRFGWGRALVARSENRELIVGHTTAAAASSLAELWADPNLQGRESWHHEAVRTATTGFVPVRFKDLSENEAHMLALADNRLGEYSQWDDDLLSEILREAAASGVPDLEQTGFLESELDLLLGRSSGEAASGDGETVEFTADTGKELIRLRVAIADGERTREAIRRALERAQIAYEFG